MFSIRLTLTSCGAALALFLALGLPAAYWFSRSRSPGAKAAACFITLPLVFPPIALGYMARASGEVGVTMMLGGNIAGRTNTLSLEIFNSVSRGDFDEATSLCLLLGSVSMAIYFILVRLQKES